MCKLVRWIHPTKESFRAETAAEKSEREEGLPLIHLLQKYFLSAIFASRFYIFVFSSSTVSQKVIYVHEK